jgi:hypothetical protein
MAAADAIVSATAQDPFTLYIHRIPQRVFARMLCGSIGKYLCSTWGVNPVHLTDLCMEEVATLYTILASKSVNYLHAFLRETYPEPGFHLKALNGSTRREVVEWFFTHDYNRLKTV